MGNELTGKKASSTYTGLVQYIGGQYYDGAGNLLSITDFADLTAALANYIDDASLSKSKFKWVSGLLEPSVAGGGGDVSKEYVDGSLSVITSRHNFTETSLGILTLRHNFTETSLNTLIYSLTNYIEDASLNQSTFKWVGGLLEPSSAGGDVTKEYVDGSLGKVDASISSIINSLSGVYTKVQVDSSFALKTDVNSSLNNFLKNTTDDFTGVLTIDGCVGINREPSYSLDVSGTFRVVSSSNGLGQSTMSTGLVVNNGEGVESINNFIVKLRNYNGIVSNSSENSIQLMSDASGKIGFFGTTPSLKSTGWDVSNGSGYKVLNVSTATLADVAETLGTLIDELKSKGLIG